MPADAVIQLPAGIFRLERYMSVLFLTSSMRHPISPKYPCNRLIINGDILSQEKSGEVGTGLCICPKKKVAKSGRACVFVPRKRWRSRAGLVYLSQEKSGEVGPGLCICPKKKVSKSCQCRGGLHALPKTMFDLFLCVCVICNNSFNSLILDIFQRLGHFLREGMKPSPAVGKCTNDAWICTLNKRVA